MSRRPIPNRVLDTVVLACLAVAGILPSLESPSMADEPAKAAPITVAEARGRAKLLHEAFHATLHIVHLRYYREDEGQIIPARTLESVFGELERRQQVKLRWLAVNATAMNVDHNPKGKFETGRILPFFDCNNRLTRYTYSLS